MILLIIMRDFLSREICRMSGNTKGKENVNLVGPCDTEEECN